VTETRQRPRPTTTRVRSGSVTAAGASAAVARARRAPAPRAPPRARPRHLRVVDPRLLKRQRRARRLVVGAGLLVLAALFAMVAFHVELAEGQMSLQKIQQETAVEQQRYEASRLNVAMLESPQRIVDGAARLGLAAPTNTITLSGGPAVKKHSNVDATQPWETAKPDLAARP
jgi:cell division protein FtsL